MSLPTNFFIGRGGGGSLIALDFEASQADGMLQPTMTSQEIGGTTFWFTNNVDNATSVRAFDVYANEGLEFYVAMIGASGGGKRAGTGNGAGGIGIARLAVPSGCTQIKCYIGGAGETNYNAGQYANGGQNHGGRGGTNSSSGYYHSSGGGGFTGIYTIPNPTTTSQSGLLCCVGSSGGGGGTSQQVSGSGGGFNQNGLGGLGDVPSNSSYTAGGGSLTSGGSAPSNSGPYYWNNRGFDGDPIQGGRGGDGQYEAGGGGGAGYYGGAGGHPGGGYNSGSGGGGSGYLHTGFGTVLAANRSANNNGTQLRGMINSQTGIDVSAYVGGSYGQAAGQQNEGRAGTMVFWHD